EEKSHPVMPVVSQGVEFTIINSPLDPREDGKWDQVLPEDGKVLVKVNFGRAVKAEDTRLKAHYGKAGEVWKEIEGRCIESDGTSCCFEIIIPQGARMYTLRASPDFGKMTWSWFTDYGSYINVLTPSMLAEKEARLKEEMKKEVRVHVRWMIRRDMPEVLAIEPEAFEFPWSEEDFIRCLRQRNNVGMVAEHDDKVVGFMIYGLQKKRIHVLNFAVAGDYRRQGVGSQMVAKLIAKLSNQEFSNITLEVRETNISAQLFFRENGFRAVATLHGYYADTSEDAYMMQLKYDPNRKSGGYRHRAGSPASCLESIVKYCGKDMGRDFSAEDLLKAGLRKRKDGKDLDIDTVKWELRRLHQADVLDLVEGSRPYRYVLKSDIRNLSPPQRKIAISSICSMPELMDTITPPKFFKSIMPIVVGKAIQNAAKLPADKAKQSKATAARDRSTGTVSGPSDGAALKEPPVKPVVPIKNIVVVDDDSPRLETYKELYSRRVQGTKIHFFIVGEDAQKFILDRNNNVGLVVTDQDLSRTSKISGAHIAHAIRDSEAPQIKGLPVIFVSSTGLEADELRNIGNAAYYREINDAIVIINQLIGESNAVVQPNGDGAAPEEPSSDTHEEHARKMEHISEPFDANPPSSPRDWVFLEGYLSIDEARKKLLAMSTQYACVHIDETGPFDAAELKKLLKTGNLEFGLIRARFGTWLLVKGIRGGVVYPEPYSNFLSFVIHSHPKRILKEELRKKRSDWWQLRDWRNAYMGPSTWDEGKAITSGPYIEYILSSEGISAFGRALTKPLLIGWKELEAAKLPIPDLDKYFIKKAREDGCFNADEPEMREGEITAQAGEDRTRRMDQLPAAGPISATAAQSGAAKSSVPKSYMPPRALTAEDLLGKLDKADWSERLRLKKQIILLGRSAIDDLVFAVGYPPTHASDCASSALTEIAKVSPREVDTAIRRELVKHPNNLRLIDLLENLNRSSNGFASQTVKSLDTPERSGTYPDDPRSGRRKLEKDFGGDPLRSLERARGYWQKDKNLRGEPEGATPQTVETIVAEFSVLRHKIAVFFDYYKSEEDLWSDYPTKNKLIGLYIGDVKNILIAARAASAAHADETSDRLIRDITSAYEELVLQRVFLDIGEGLRRSAIEMRAALNKYCDGIEIKRENPQEGNFKMAGISMMCANDIINMFKSLIEIRRNPEEDSGIRKVLDSFDGFKKSLQVKVVQKNASTYDEILSKAEALFKEIDRPYDTVSEYLDKFTRDNMADAAEYFMNGTVPDGQSARDVFLRLLSAKIRALETFIANVKQKFPAPPGEGGGLVTKFDLDNVEEQLAWIRNNVSSRMRGIDTIRLWLQDRDDKAYSSNDDQITGIMRQLSALQNFYRPIQDLFEKENQEIVGYGSQICDKLRELYYLAHRNEYEIISDPEGETGYKKIVYGYLNEIRMAVRLEVGIADICESILMEGFWRKNLDIYIGTIPAGNRAESIRKLDETENLLKRVVELKAQQRAGLSPHNKSPGAQSPALLAAPFIFVPYFNVILAVTLGYVYISAHKDAILKWLAVNSDKHKWFGSIFRFLYILAYYSLWETVPRQYLTYIAPVFTGVPIVMAVIPQDEEASGRAFKAGGKRGRLTAGEIVERFRNELRRVDNAVVDKLKKSSDNLGECRRILKDAGVTFADKIYATFLVDEIRRLVESRSASDKERPVSNVLRQWYEGR
ncbi:MAG: ribosomal protein S18-alanine N-acetyltransferase, partial [Candidatus Omnitrophota bacterium]